MSGCAGALSATTVVRFKQAWRSEYESWSKRSLAGQSFVYLWADGIYSNISLDEERQCLLVVIGALEGGRKQLLVVISGFRDTEMSRTRILVDLKARGLKLGPKVAVGDGGLGFWAELRKTFSKHQTAALLRAQDGQCVRQHAGQG